MKVDGECGSHSPDPEDVAFAKKGDDEVLVVEKNEGNEEEKAEEKEEEKEEGKENVLGEVVEGSMKLADGRDLYYQQTGDIHHGKGKYNSYSNYLQRETHISFPHKKKSTSNLSPTHALPQAFPHSSSTEPLGLGTSLRFRLSFTL